MHHFKAIGEFKPELQSWNAQFGSQSAIFCPVWHLNLMDDLEKQQDTSFILREALCVISKPSVNSNWSYSPEMLNSGQIGDFFPAWPRNLTDDPEKKGISSIYICISTISSFVHHFKAIGEFKLELSPDTLNAGQNRRFSVPCDLEIWWMTLNNNRTSLLCYFKLCALFHSHLWIETRVTVRKRPI